MQSGIGLSATFSFCGFNTASGKEPIAIATIAKVLRFQIASFNTASGKEPIAIPVEFTNGDPVPGFNTASGKEPIAIKPTLCRLIWEAEFQYRKR